MAEVRSNTQVNRSVAWAGAAQAIIAVTDLVSYLIVVAFFADSGELGRASAAMTFYLLLDTAADFGVTSALIQRDDHTPERVSTVFWFNVFVSTGLFVLLLGAGPLYAWVIDRPIVGWLLIAYGGKLLLQNLYAIPFALLRKEMRFADIAKARIVAHLAESVGRVIYAALGLTVWCWTLSALTRALVFGVIMQLWHPFVPKLVFRPREVIDYVRFGLRTAASQILYRLYVALDQPIVLYYFGDEASGVYALALYIILEPVKTISNVVIDVAFPTFARLRSDMAALVAQFLQFTRLNLLAVLPFLVVTALVIPEMLRMFLAKSDWTEADVQLCVDVTRILCAVGTLRALGFIGPPLLDGVGRPELTLRYMVIATISVPISFVVGAELLGGALGARSVAIAWALGYPVAFAAQQYLVSKCIDLPLGRYARSSWGIVACCLAGLVAGAAVSFALSSASDAVRLVSIGGTALVVTFVLVGVWQRITPRSVIAAIRG